MQKPHPPRQTNTLNAAAVRKNATASGNEFTYAKVPPQTPDMEQAVLGALLLHSSALEDVIGLLKRESFYDPKHQDIYQAILDLDAAGSKIDLLTVPEQLRKAGVLDKIGGSYYLTGLTMAVVSSANIEDHAKLIQEKYMLRETIQLATNAVSDAYKPGADPFEVMDRLDANLTSITIGNLARPYSNASELAKIAMSDLDHIITHKDEVTGVPTGYRRLDELTNGWQPGNLIIVAARPAVGKTAFVQALAINAAQHPTKPSAIGMFSLEMSKSELMKRFICSMSNVALDDLLKGKLDSSEIDRYMQAVQRFSKLPIVIDDQAALNMFELRAKARRMKSRQNVELIIVDYLQLMTGSVSGGNREQEISKISRELKALAKELHIPIIALSQLNRALEGRADKTPQLSDLRESGAIEQDADCVMFLTRPDYQKSVEEFKGNSIEDNADIHIRKNRMGGNDDIPMYFVKKIQRWFDRVGYDDYRGTSHFKSTPTPEPKPYSSAINTHYQREVRHFDEPTTQEEEPGDMPF